MTLTQTYFFTGEPGQIIKRFRKYELYTGPVVSLTSLGTMDGVSVIDCTGRCTIMEGCGGVKVTNAGNKGKKICTMYKGPDGVNIVQETNLYAWRPQ